MTGSKYLKLIGLRVYSLEASYIGTVSDIGLMRTGEGFQLYLVISRSDTAVAVPVTAIHSVGDIVLLREGYEEEVIGTPSEALESLREPATGHPAAAREEGSPGRGGEQAITIPRCPSCGSALIYEPRKRQWYCPKCKKYVRIPAEVEAKVPRCPVCGLPLSYIEEYGKWYCYNCRRYVDVEQ